MLEIFITAVLLALSAVSTTVSLRTLIKTDRKPISCDVCMATWTVLLSTLASGLLSFRGLVELDVVAPLLAAFPAHGLAVLMLRRLTPFSLPLDKLGPDA